MKGKKFLVISLVIIGLLSASSTAYASTASNKKNSPKNHVNYNNSSSKKKNTDKKDAKKNHAHKNKKKKNDKDSSSDKKTVNPLAKLITDGIITQDQANDILAAIKSSKGDVKGSLDKLVTAETITQAQEDAVMNLFPQKAQNISTTVKSILDGLVSSGKITQAQETSIINLLLSIFK